VGGSHPGEKTPGPSPLQTHACCVTVGMRGCRATEHVACRTPGRSLAAPTHVQHRKTDPCAQANFCHVRGRVQGPQRHGPRAPSKPPLKAAACADSCAARRAKAEGYTAPTHDRKRPHTTPATPSQQARNRHGRTSMLYLPPPLTCVPPWTWPQLADDWIPLRLLCPGPCPCPCPRQRWPMWRVAHCCRNPWEGGGEGRGNGGRGTRVYPIVKPCTVSQPPSPLPSSPAPRIPSPWRHPAAVYVIVNVDGPLRASGKWHRTADVGGQLGDSNPVTLLVLPGDARPRPPDRTPSLAH
jgi:hypothetical protein